MLDEQLLEERHHALMSLVQCAQYLRERDNIIRRAAAAGVSQSEIARILGLHRSTIHEAVKKGIA